MSRPLVIGAAIGAAAAGRRAWARARSLDLGGRVAVVTGGSRGLGYAIADELLAQGAHVAICARGEEDLERARRKLAADGRIVLARPCDVGVREQVEAFVTDVARELGPVDVLVNNAGVISVGPWQTQTIEDFEELAAIQFLGVVYATWAVLPSMVERGVGRIANVTSIGGKLAVPWLLPYCSAKYGAVGFSEGLRAELGGTGVRVTTVVPGLMRTGSYSAALFKGDRARTEYSLFTPLSVTPLSTVSGRRAARRIVAALRRGDAEIVLGLHAKLAARANGIAPGLAADALGVVARVLPQSRGNGRVRGDRIDSPLDRSPVTALGRRAAADLNQRV
jgi:NAD(P)-dependent dehydrogenase (short-subunit alcohol dehydrogenase family)